MLLTFKKQDKVFKPI